MRSRHAAGDRVTEQMADLRYRTMQKAKRRYRIEAYDGPIMLFRATNRDLRPGTFIQSNLGWRRVLPTELHVYDVPSEHIDMLKQPHVQMLADLMRQYMHNIES